MSVQLIGPGSVKIGVNALQYIASYTDLMDLLGVNAQGRVDHYDEYGYLEGR